MTRVTLSSHQTQTFTPIYGDRLFYDHYEYSIGLNLEECWALRHSLDHNSIEIILEDRHQWRLTMRDRWNHTTRPFLAITEEHRADVKKFASLLSIYPNEFKLIVQSNTARVYTNNLKLIWDIQQAEFGTKKQRTQAVVDRPKGTIAVRNPKHRYRGYFRSIVLDLEAKATLAKFLDNQSDIRIGPGLQDYLTGKWHRTMDHYFVDYNDSRWLTMLSLVQPGLIRKTMEIIAK